MSAQKRDAEDIKQKTQNRKCKTEQYKNEDIYGNKVSMGQDRYETG